MKTGDNMIKNKYSVLSVDSNPDYLFFVPITCAFWRKIGYQPFVILIEKEINDDLMELIDASTDHVGGIIHRMEHIEGYRTCNVAQISRLYAAADSFFDDDDYLITDDMDKFVISYPWFNQQDFTKDIHIFDPDELNYTRLKIGNIGMKAKIWKEVIGIEDVSFRDNLKNALNTNLSKDSDWNTGWNVDEWILTKGVFNSKYYPENCQMCVRGAGRYGSRNGRIDRGAWQQTFDEYLYSGIIDVHLHRDPYEDSIWKDTKAIMSRVFSPSEIDMFESYKQQFIKILKG